MTQEEKAKAYDEAIKRAKYYYNEGKTLEYATDVASYIFPKLKESKDEKIKKTLINLVKSNGTAYYINQIHIDDIFAWLEKQGEPNPYSGTSFEYNGHTWGMCARDGGVLAASDGSIFIFAGIINESCKYHIALSTNGEILVNKDENHYWETISGARPATREQCNLLFEKMAKKGYRWNTSNNKIVKL